MRLSEMPYEEVRTFLAANYYNLLALVKSAPEDMNSSVDEEFIFNISQPFASDIKFEKFEIEMIEDFLDDMLDVEPANDFVANYQRFGWEEFFTLDDYVS